MLSGLTASSSILVDPEYTVKPRMASKLFSKKIRAHSFLIIHSLGCSYILFITQDVLNHDKVGTPYRGPL